MKKKSNKSMKSQNGPMNSLKEKLESLSKRLKSLLGLNKDNAKDAVQLTKKAKKSSKK